LANICQSYDMVYGGTVFLTKKQKVPLLSHHYKIHASTEACCGATGKSL